MEEHFAEKELVKQKAQFMALTYTHLCGLFSDQYLHEQAIYFGKQSLPYYIYNEEPRHIAWILDEIGSQYEMKDDIDSAEAYYQKGIEMLSDTNNITYRDLKTRIALHSYMKGEDPKITLGALYLLLKQAESEEEILSRYLILGGIYYYETQYDSSLLYLSKVYECTKSVGSKKQSAEWLVEICNITNKSGEAQEYAAYLVPFANSDETQGRLKSQLTKTCIEYEQNKKDNLHRKVIKKTMTQVGFATIGLIVLISVGVLVSFSINKKKHRKQLEDERFAHRIQQAALGGRLKQKNRALKKLLLTINPDTSLDNSKQETQNNFFDETICKHILMVCNDENNPIKSTVPISAYADIALNARQKTELKKAAVKHYGFLFKKLEKLYPGLKEKDLFYCYLALLDLNNTQIAVLLQNAPNTIWDREQRLKKIFGKNDSVALILNEFIIQ